MHQLISDSFNTTNNFVLLRLIFQEITLWSNNNLIELSMDVYNKKRIQSRLKKIYWS